MDTKTLENLYCELKECRQNNDEAGIILTRSKILDEIGITNATMLSLDFSNFIYSSEDAAKELKALLAVEFKRGYRRALEIVAAAAKNGLQNSECASLKARNCRLLNIAFS